MTTADPLSASEWHQPLTALHGGGGAWLTQPACPQRMKSSRVTSSCQFETLRFMERLNKLVKGAADNFILLQLICMK